MRAAAVGGDSDVRLMLADRETPGDRLDECFLKVEVSATNVARAVDQERNVSGNRDVGYSWIYHNTSYFQDIYWSPKLTFDMGTLCGVRNDLLHLLTTCW